jgi:hypothetical protein
VGGPSFSSDTLNHSRKARSSTFCAEGWEATKQAGPSVLDLANKISKDLQGRGVVSVTVRLYDDLHILVERH